MLQMTDHPRFPQAALDAAGDGMPLKIDKKTS